MTKLAISALVLAVGARADFDPAKWALRQPIETPNGAKIAYIVVDSKVYAGSSGQLRDLRIESNGAEIPYDLEELRPVHQLEEFETPILDKAVVDGERLEAILDFGKRTHHNQIRVRT